MVRTGQVYRSSISSRTHQVRENVLVLSSGRSRCLDIRSDLLPCRLQSSRFLFTSNTLHFLRDLRSHCGLPGGLGLMTWTGCLQTVMYSHLGISSEIRRPHLISGPSSPHCVDSAVPSRPPLVHGFPSPLDALERVRSGGIDCPLPDHQGVLLHTVTSASSALSRWYYP